MKKIYLVWLFAATAFISCTESRSKQDTAVATISNDSLIARGRYMVSVMACDDCHSPKKMGPHGPEIIEELRFSGYPAYEDLPKQDGSALKSGYVLFKGDLTAAIGPWGTSFAANISSDETGIGNWTEENFKRAITQGKYKGIENARDLLPPMPWPVFKNLTDQDVKAIYMYLKSSNPVRNIVPPPIPPSGI